MKKRPVNLDLGSFSYPPMAIASILHRISGVFIFLLLPIVLYALWLSVTSSDGFDHLQTILHSCIWFKSSLGIMAAAMIYHVIAGLRHIMMDMGIMGEDLKSGRQSALWVIILSAAIILGMGVWLW